MVGGVYGGGGFGGVGGPVRVRGCDQLLVGIQS